jgi:hypothetical protein
MRHASQALGAVLLSTLLSACGFMTPARQYAGELKDTSQIAVIRGYLGSPLGEEYHATIAGYAHTDSSGVQTTKRFGWTGFTDYPKEIQVDPGSYAFEMYCFKSLTKPSYRPTLIVPVRAGYAYTVKCEAGAGKAEVFVSQETRLL